ncbi:hypothetical protein B0H16DRAFT_1469473 [Mycena metata]|uniref:Uncharacterized protein n=1 Tax=Mycena metata TaxID=1033252 RepID=A0AAD7HY99_9AGAR|nr:hypothetical protein B0H16DRAFT_1469473 [Mycena metata]
MDVPGALFWARLKAIALPRVPDYDELLAGHGPTRHILQPQQTIVDLEVSVDETNDVHSLDDAQELDREEHIEQLAKGVGVVDDVEQGTMRKDVQDDIAFVSEGQQRVGRDDRASQIWCEGMQPPQIAVLPKIPRPDDLKGDHKRTIFVLLIQVFPLLVAGGNGSHTRYMRRCIPWDDSRDSHTVTTEYETDGNRGTHGVEQKRAPRDGITNGVLGRHTDKDYAAQEVAELKMAKTYTRWTKIEGLQLIIENKTGLCNRLPTLQERREPRRPLPSREAQNRVVEGGAFRTRCKRTRHQRRFAPSWSYMHYEMHGGDGAKRLSSPRVQQYLSNGRTPAQAKNAAQLLFRAAHAVSKGRVDDVCQDCSGNSAKIILTCCEFNYPYHLHCIRRRHFDQMFGLEQLFGCRYCSERSKPINVEWLIMPRKEHEDRRRHKHKISRERRAEQLKMNKEMKAKEMARNTDRLRRRRARRKNSDN